MLGAVRAALFGARQRPFNGRTDIAAAFSLRRLRSAYAGPLIRIRRSSDSAEKDFSAGTQSFVPWAAISDFIGAGSGFVSKWYDQSGLGRDLAQSTAANQPSISLLANGLPGMTFDGVNDSLVTATFTLNQPSTFNIVYRRVTHAQVSLENTFDGVSPDVGTLFGGLGSGGVAGADNRLFAGNIANFGDAGVSMPLGTRGAVGGTFNSTTSLLSVNAATVAAFSGGDVGLNNADGLTVGGRGGGISTRFDNIEVQEIIRFNTAHLAATLAADNASMRAAWRF